MCMCVCVFLRERMNMCAHMCMWSTQADVRKNSQSLTPYPLREHLLIKPELPALGLPRLCFTRWATTIIWYLLGIWDLNSGLHACTASLYPPNCLYSLSFFLIGGGGVLKTKPRVSITFDMR